MKKEIITPNGSNNNNKTAVIVVLSLLLAILLVLSCLGWGLYFWQKFQMKKENEKFLKQTEKRQEQRLTQPDVNPFLNENENAASFKIEPPAVETPAEPEIPSDPNVWEKEDGFLPPASGVEDIGYIKSIYAKNGKTYLDIDYIQWLSGDEAEKAMREDGKCESKGECIVLNDYYIRNQNPMIRTYEILPNTEIRMQTFNSETEGMQPGRHITLDQLKSALKGDRYEFVPFLLDVKNQQALKITEQYIP